MKLNIARATIKVILHSTRRTDFLPIQSSISSIAIAAAMNKPKRIPVTIIQAVIPRRRVCENWST